MRCLRDCPMRSPAAIVALYCPPSLRSAARASLLHALRALPWGLTLLERTCRLMRYGARPEDVREGSYRGTPAGRHSAKPAFSPKLVVLFF